MTAANGVPLSNDLVFGESLFCASVDVGLGSGVVAHAAEGDGVESAVAGAVAAAVEAVAVFAAGTGGGWGRLPTGGLAPLRCEAGRGCRQRWSAVARRPLCRRRTARTAGVSIPPKRGGLRYAASALRASAINRS